MPDVVSGLGMLMLEQGGWGFNQWFNFIFSSGFRLGFKFHHLRAKLKVFCYFCRTVQPSLRKLHSQYV